MIEMFGTAFAFGTGFFIALTAVAAAVFLIGFSILFVFGLVSGMIKHRRFTRLKAARLARDAARIKSRPISQQFGSNPGAFQPASHLEQPNGRSAAKIGAHRG